MDARSERRERQTTIEVLTENQTGPPLPFVIFIIPLLLQGDYPSLLFLQLHSKKAMDRDQVIAETSEDDNNVTPVEDVHENDAGSDEEEDECRVCRGPAEEG